MAQEGGHAGQTIYMYSTQPAAISVFLFADIRRNDCLRAKCAESFIPFPDQERAVQEL